MFRYMLLAFLLFVTQTLQENNISFSPKEIDIEKNVSVPVSVNLNKDSFGCDLVVFNYAYGESAISYEEEQEVVIPQPNRTICGAAFNFTIQVTSNKAGSILVGASLFRNNSFELLDGFFKVTVIHYYWLDVLQKVVGWVYFLAWSLSFYPQVISNFMRKNVTGLSFDYTFLNFVGFFFYTIFNLTLFWNPNIQHQYHQLHPRGNIPVEPNDVAFSLHALLVTIVIMVQCCIYERGNQRISKLGFGIIVAIFVVAIVTILVGAKGVISWLVVVTVFSYVKIFVTSIKYFPQMWLNFSRKSTEGWCVGNVICDFIGGVGSFLQMMLIASNNDDWSIIYGNVTKLFLGIAAILFDTVFFLQHCIYKQGSNLIAYESIE